MRRALELAALPAFTAPNPHVGCVVVKDGRIVGQGHSDPAGGAHAEVNALAEAGTEARGAEVFVTLEPCNHTGRTGPCSQALIQAGVARVVYAVDDPNPVAVGGGATLRAAGISVDSGLLHEEAEQVHTQFLTAHRLQRPYVGLKVATTLDACVTYADGRSKWITGEEARERGRLLRAELGAVLVGSGTVLADDPALTARHPEVNNEPLRVILDRRGRLTGAEQVFQGPGRALWLVAEEVQDGQTALDDWSISSILSVLWKQGCTGVLVEGGPATWTSFVESGLVDQLDLFTAPIVVGAGRKWIDSSWLPERGFRLRLISTQPVGPDLWQRFRTQGTLAR